MKKIFRLAFLSMLLSWSLNGQNTPTGGCGTVLDSKTVEHLESLEPQVQQRISALAKGDQPEAFATIPVKFYYVRNSNGTGAASVTPSSVLSYLNGKFSGSNLYFLQCGATGYIDDTNLYNLDTSEEPQLLTAGYTPGVLNIYLVNYLTSGNGVLSGYSYIPNTNKPDIAVIDYDYATTSTMAHEIGHFFGLYHTHGKVNCGPITDELVNGCNCKTAGDNVCDTPADPGLQGINCSGYIVNGCTYSNTTLKDANQQVFVPMVSNLMSYAPENCRTQFTQGQKDRMQAQFQLFRSYLACPTVCGTPGSVFASESTLASVKVNWSAVTGNIRYEVQYRPANGNWLPLTLVPTTGTFLILNNLLQTTSYQCRVRAVCEFGVSEWRESSVFSTLSPCAIPGGRSTSNITTSSVKFNWAAVSGGSTYTIQVRAVGSPYWNKSVSTSGTSYTFLSTDGTNISSDRGLASNMPYEWRIRTNCSNGLYSDWSSPVQFTTPSETCNSPLPSDLVVINNTSYSITVKCNKPGVSYKFRRTGGFQVDASSSNTYTFSADPCTTYEVQCFVRCQSGGPYSKYSASIFVTTPGCGACTVPTIQTSSSATHNSATINWSSSPGASSCSMQWKQGNSPWTDLAQPVLYGTSTTIQNLQPATPYQFRIRANCSNEQNSGWSAAYSITTAPAPCGQPQGLKAVNASQTAATLVWGAPPVGASTYTLRYGPNSGSMTEISVTGTTRTLTSLTPGTNYVWQLRTNCGVNQSSAWKSGANFSTLPANSLNASPATQNVGFNPGSATISVTANVEWTAAILPAASWLSLCPSSGIGNGTMTATFAANTGSSSRSATVVVTGGGITKSVTIVQAGNTSPNCYNDSEPTNNTTANAPTIALNTDKKSQIGFSGDEDFWKIVLTTPQNLTVSLTTLPVNCELKLLNATGTEIGSSTSGGTSNESIVKTNLAAGTYFAKVYGYNGANSGTQCYTLRANTSAANTLTVSPSTQNVPAGSGSTTFSISSNVSWTALEISSWLTLSPTSGTGNATLTATYQANTTSSARTTTISVSGGGISQTLTITQAGNVSGCHAPGNPNTNAITQNTATIQWGSVPNATGYQVQFFINGSWTNVGGPTTNLSMGIYGLVPNTSYQWRVITICSGGQQSTPSSAVSFSTPSVANCTSGIQASGTALNPSGSWQYSTGLSGGYYRLVNVQSGTTYTFSLCSSDGGSAPFDAEMSIRNTSNQLIAYSDDVCGNAPKIVWQASFTGQVRLLLTQYTCQTNSAGCTVAYRTGSAFQSEEVADRTSTMEYRPLPVSTLGEEVAHLDETVDHNASSTLELSVSPNPTRNHFFILCNNNAGAEMATLQVLDQLGRVVWHNADLLETGPNTWQIPVVDWPAGLYFVSMTTRTGETLLKKVVVSSN